MRFLTAIPVYNEQRHLEEVLTAVQYWSPEVLVIDDGSTDQTPTLLKRFATVRVLRHDENQGYGAALRAAFAYALDSGYAVLVTMDCDGQHEPERIPELLAAIEEADIVSGSRYLKVFAGDSEPPPERRRINRLITEELNRQLGLELTDAFCGFKAYRASALRRFRITEPGYGMPLQLWVQAAANRLRIKEVPVPLIYLEEERAFGGALDQADQRLAYYRQVIECELERVGLGSAGRHGGASPTVAAERC